MMNCRNFYRHVNPNYKNPLLKVTKYLPNLQFGKRHLLSKKILGWKIGQKFQKTATFPEDNFKSNIVLPIVSFFLTEKKTVEKNDEFYEFSKTCKPKLEKPISSQQPGGPLA